MNRKTFGRVLGIWVLLCLSACGGLGGKKEEGGKEGAGKEEKANEQAGKKQDEQVKKAMQKALDQAANAKGENGPAAAAAPDANADVIPFNDGLGNLTAVPNAGLGGGLNFAGGFQNAGLAQNGLAAVPPGVPVRPIGLTGANLRGVASQAPRSHAGAPVVPAVLRPRAR